VGYTAVVLLALLALLTPEQTKAPAPFVNKLALEEMAKKQAVVNTTEGEFIIDLRPDLAPNHVGHFIKLAREGAYNGTIFHRIIRHGIVQGGDPLSKDPAKAKAYGTGGLGVLKAEFGSEPTTRGAVAAVLQPGKPDSGGAQFFICVSDQPALAGKYTIFGRVNEGMDVVQKISEAAASAEGVPAARIEIVSVTIRDTPPTAPEPFSTETVEEIAQYRAVLETDLGPITLGFFPDTAPGHVRNFLRLAGAGVYDGMAFHRVVRKFAVQTGSLDSRGPLTEKQQKLVKMLPPEFSDIKHVKGIVSMARGDDPASASTSFFLVTADAPTLDGKYTVFGQVVDGLPVLEKIEAAPVTGETPTQRIGVKTIRVVKSPGP
jgi:cyclophilin family peptidyl-prolyl cis-trans isomerase